MTVPTITYRLQLKVNDMDKDNLLQCAVYEPEDQKWYLAQARTAGARDKEHTFIRRFSKNGAYEGYCKLVLWGHGNQIGVRKSDAGNVWIWAPMDNYNSAGSTIRTTVSRVIFKKSHTYERKERGSGGTVDIFADDTKGDNGFSLGLPRKPKNLFLRRGLSGSEIYRRVDEAEYTAKNGKAKVTGQIEVSKSPGKYFQGCAADGDMLAVLRGSTVYSNSSHTHHVKIYSFSKKKMTAHLEVGFSLLKKRIGPHITAPSSFECEGLMFIDHKLYMGVRSGPGGARRDFALMEVEW